MENRKRKNKLTATHRGRRRLRLEQEYGARLRYLVGCILEALQGYDCDDGNNQLVMAGITSELKSIQFDYENGHVIASRSPERT